MRLLSFRPNPTNGLLFVDVDPLQATNLELSISNLLGATVLRQGHSVSSATQLMLDLSDQPNGVYLVRVKGAGRAVHQRVILSR